MQCPDPAKPVNVFWHMYSLSATLRTLQNCFKLECKKHLACKAIRFSPTWTTFQCAEKLS